MKNITTFLAIVFFTTSIFAHTDANKEEEHVQQDARAFLQGIFDENSRHIKKHLTSELATIQDGQTPLATVVSCSDSRVQSDTIDSTPVNNLFYIRNIGNQIETTLGSVKYGVRYLHTPVLLIIGHVDCGAVGAALGDYKHKPKALRKELHTFDFPEGITKKNGVILNVHNQVDTALKHFKEEVQDKSLVVIGAVYDFKNEYKQGYSRLIVVNLNGEKDPKVISESSYFKGMNHVKIGVE